MVKLIFFKSAVKRESHRDADPSTLRPNQLHPVKTVSGPWLHVILSDWITVGHKHVTDHSSQQLIHILFILWYHKDSLNELVSGLTKYNSGLMNVLESSNVTPGKSRLPAGEYTEHQTESWERHFITNHPREQETSQEQSCASNNCRDINVQRTERGSNQNF